MATLRDFNIQSGDSRTLGTWRAGFLPSELPTGGTDGDNILLNDDLDPAKEYMPVVQTWPATGELFVFENGSFTFEPAGDGEESFTYRLKEDGILLAGTATVALASGSASASITVPGIASAEAFGTATVTRLGAASVSPAGIASAEAFGVPVVSAGTLVLPTGIPSAEAFGVPQFAWPVSLQVFGIPSAEAFGTAYFDSNGGGGVGGYLVTLAQARAHIRSDEDADDADLELKIAAASAAVVDYLGEAAEGFADADGKVLAGQTVPSRVQMATLLTIGYLYRERDGSQENAVPSQYGYGYALPQSAISLLYSMRKPVIA